MFIIDKLYTLGRDNAVKEGEKVNRVQKRGRTCLFHRFRRFKRKRGRKTSFRYLGERKIVRVMIMRKDKS